MSWFKRATEGLPEQLAATGALAGADPIDPNDVGFRQAGAGRREAPAYTLTKLRAMSVHHYRMNPMAKAIVDTYTAFCVGSSGLTLQCTSPDVRPIAEGFWRDPMNQLADFRHQELLLRGHILLGETILELLVGESTGVTRYSYIDPEQVLGVELDRGNPLWPAKIVARSGIAGVDERTLDIARFDDLKGLRMGEVLFVPSWKAVPSDRRGYPFLSTILDWLSDYDEVLSNLIDRTRIGRYFVWDVEIEGDETAIKNFIDQRKGMQAPRSGSLEIHNPGVKWEPKTVQVGAYEDRVTSQSIMTNLAAGTGLAKTWLAEPEDANRATSLTMAEPVRRRVGGVQNLWLAINTELVRFAVDQAVARGRIEKTVKVKNEAGDEVEVAASETVSITGPEIAASDAKVSAEILAKLSGSLNQLVKSGILSGEAARVAVKKAWEDYVGIPYKPELDDPDRTDDIAAEIENEAAKSPLSVAS